MYSPVNDWKLNYLWPTEKERMAIFLYSLGNNIPNPLEKVECKKQELKCNCIRKNNGSLRLKLAEISYDIIF